jgi:hypothetical protein
MTDLFPAPDPIQSPREYQDHLLRVLGDDDPVAVQSQTPSTLRTLAQEAGANLFRRSDPREWSVGECIAHVYDAEVVMSGRYRFILAQDEPPIVGYDQDLWVDRLHGDQDDIEDMIDTFEVLRRSNIDLWAASTPEQRQRAGIHSERGPETYELAFLMIGGHDRFHIGQARRAMEPFARS